MNNRILFTATCLLALMACSREPDSAPPPVPATSGAAAPAAVPASGKTTVAAVREGSGNAAVKVRFLLEKPPIVGQELQLRIDFSSYISQPVTLEVKFSGDQIQLQPDATATTVSLPRSGEDVSHMLALTPQAAGLSELMVFVKIAGEDAGAEVTYVIPILADVAAKSP
jgi:hypothetical protein